MGYRRLAGLTDLGLLSYTRPFDDQPGAFSVTAAGLKLIQSPLAAPVIDLGCFRHDAALVSLHLAVRAASPAEILSEREMRSADRDPDQDPFFLELHQLGPGGRPRRHYPDLVLLDPSGGRRAIELELTQKSRSRLELILIAFAAHPHTQLVTYITDTPAIAQALATTSTNLGTAHQIEIRLTGQPVGSTTPLTLAPPEDQR